MACPNGGGIESVEMAAGGADPSDWNETVLELNAVGSASLHDRVSLDGDSPGYSLTRVDDLGYVRVTAFNLDVGNALGTVWDVELDDVMPGEVATRDGVVSAAAWERTCR